jgi:hypothetical protein
MDTTGVENAPAPLGWQGGKEGRMEEVKPWTDCEEDCIDGRKRDTYYAGPLEREEMRC